MDDKQLPEGIFWRGSRLWIRYSVRGQQFREPAMTASVREAKAPLRQRTGQIEAGRFIGPKGEKITLDDLARMVTDDYPANSRRSMARLRRSWVQLREHFGGETRAVHITTDRIRAYIAARMEAGIAPGTIYQQVAGLRRGLRLARLPKIPMPRVNKARRGFLNRETCKPCWPSRHNI